MWVRPHENQGEEAEILHHRILWDEEEILLNTRRTKDGASTDVTKISQGNIKTLKVF
jgi:hypothetical protein